MAVATKSSYLVRAASLAEVETAGCLVIPLQGHTVVLFAQNGKVYALDNRCPHMGFPLQRGTVQDGILTCHWHHARFDIASGGTFDPWADDVRVFPTEIRDGEVWVDLTPPADPNAHHRGRLREGLERDISLVTGKAVIALLSGGENPAVPFQIALEFGVRNRSAGWGAGLTILTCIMNLLPRLDAEDHPRALYHGVSAVARDCAGNAPRFSLRPLPSLTKGWESLKQWFRQFVEVRDAEGAERCIVSAVRAGADHRLMADMLFTAATDHRYIQIGHVADFTNKALEALDVAGWDYAEPVLASLASSLASADRMEESNQWRHPVDLVAVLENAFERLPEAAAMGQRRTTQRPAQRTSCDSLLADALLAALQEGVAAEHLAGAVVHAASLRIAQFQTTNEFGDWDTAHHTFTFSNAIHQALRRASSVELLRGVFDAAMSVYLDRFLNVPPARLPDPNDVAEHPEELLHEIPGLLNRQHQVDEAGRIAGRYLYSNGNPDRLMAVLGHCLLREDRDFHTIQAIEASFR